MKTTRYYWQDLDERERPREIFLECGSR
ncbi:Bgt-50523 [Blumeria graminis f. sp. tritici]|uniref:Bgt-50523 n=1 Tax=Blumeria graminis f. sp. tritici TaxID=62690 RepID=A0A9X9QFK9_BLUGR|nr:Bgt-50523 [Blumeria graminis f. sp. tritici]